MTGRYPHHNGALGFQAIRRDVPTTLHRAGYFTGIMAKVPHLAPFGKFQWDVRVFARDLGIGRDPQLYYRQAKQFFKKSKAD